MLPIQLSVFVKKKHINDFYLIPSLKDETEEGNEDIWCVSISDCDNFVEELETFHTFKVTMDGYLCSLFYYIIKTSLPFRTKFTNYITTKSDNINKGSNYHKVLINIKLSVPKQDIIDYKGNKLFEISSLERRELDNAMAWLSTLGGAFSALGDTMESCATIAGKISVRQLEIALRLGDPFLIARCKLYLALSLIQKHRFKQAKQLVKAQFNVATQSPIKDNKLKSMCLGIWAKLKYDKNKAKLIMNENKSLGLKFHNEGGSNAEM